MPIELKTSVGRVLWGHPGKSKPKLDLATKQPKLKDGKPIEQWAFGVGFPKAEFGPIWAAMSQEAATGYPQGVPGKFAWKYVDGDGIDGNGVPYNKREGYAGHYVLTVASEAFAPPIYKFQNGGYVQLTADQMKTGDYVALALKLQVNVPSDRTFTPGLYINPVAIEHVGYGTEIQNGPDPMTLFGGQQRQLPQGASATPIAPSHGVGMPGTGGPGPQMQPNPGPAGMPGQMQPGGPPNGYPQPAPGYAPPADPRFTGGGMPGQQQMQQPGPGYQPPAPGNYAPPPNGQPQHQQMQHVQPAHDFVHNAGQQGMGNAPMGMPMPGALGAGQMPGNPAPMMQPGNGVYPSNPGNYAPMQQPQPGQMPGMPPNR